MTRKISAWQVVDLQSVEKLVHVQPDYEKHLENWITQDPSIISDDLILIGRQRQTRFGTIVDLIGINCHGDLVLIELKRNKTSREMIAQALEYGTWASTLSYKEVVEIADEFLGSEDALEEAFHEKFGVELPDTLNQAQQIVLVALSIKESTAAVVEYLSDNFGVAINAIGLSMVEVNGTKILLRDAVIEQDESTSPATRKRAQKPTIDELLEKGREAGNEGLAEYFWSIRQTFKGVETLTWSWNFHASGTKSNRVVMTVFPFGPKHARGEIGNKFVISLMPDSLSDVYGKSVEECTAFINSGQSKYGQTVPAPGTRKLRFAIETVEQGSAFFGAFCEFFGIESDFDDVQDKNEDTVSRSLQSVGMECFAKYYDRFANAEIEPSSIIEVLVQNEGYTESACQTRVSKARKIIQSGNSAEALQSIVDSPRASSTAKELANEILRRLDPKG